MYFPVYKAPGCVRASLSAKRSHSHLIVRRGGTEIRGSCHRRRVAEGRLGVARSERLCTTGSAHVARAAPGSISC